MKKAIVIFTAAIIFVSSMSNTILFAGFRFNQTEIERLYCVNKAKPQKQCHGKCHLKKQLQQNNEQDGQPSPLANLENSFKLNFFHQTFFDLKSKGDNLLAHKPLFSNPNLNSRLFGASLFQPPDAAPVCS